MLPFIAVNSCLSAGAGTGIARCDASRRMISSRSVPWPLKWTICGMYWFRYSRRSSGRTAHFVMSSSESRSSAERILWSIERLSSSSRSWSVPVGLAARKRIVDLVTARRSLATGSGLGADRPADQPTTRVADHDRASQPPRTGQGARPRAVRTDGPPAQVPRQHPSRAAPFSATPSSGRASRRSRWPR